jgi:hypothetical protein
MRVLGAYVCAHGTACIANSGSNPGSTTCQCSAGFYSSDGTTSSGSCQGPAHMQRGRGAHIHVSCVRLRGRGATACASCPAGSQCVNGQCTRTLRPIHWFDQGRTLTVSMDGVRPSLPDWLVQHRGGQQLVHGVPGQRRHAEHGCDGTVGVPVPGRLHRPQRRGVHQYDAAPCHVPTNCTLLTRSPQPNRARLCGQHVQGSDGQQRVLGVPDQQHFECRRGRMHMLGWHRGSHQPGLRVYVARACPLSLPRQTLTCGTRV